MGSTYVVGNSLADGRIIRFINSCWWEKMESSECPLVGIYNRLPVAMIGNQLCVGVIVWGCGKMKTYYFDPCYDYYFHLNTRNGSLYFIPVSVLAFECFNYILESV